MKKPFQAVAVRYVHDVLTGEFVNIGVVLLCPGQRYAGARFISQWSRVRFTFPNAELPHVRRLAAAIETACERLYPRPGETLDLTPDIDIRAFLASVLPPDDASIQFSNVIRGISSDAHATLAELTTRYAERYLPEEGTRGPRSDVDVWQAFATKLASKIDMERGLVPATLSAHGYRYDFERAWKNGKLNIAQAVSLDLLDPRAIKEKAISWTGRVITLHPSQQNAQIAFLIGMPPAGVPAPVSEAAADAVQILGENLAGEADVYTEDRSDELVERIARDFLHTIH